jgi:cystathionine beta-lyase
MGHRRSWTLGQRSYPRVMSDHPFDAVDEATLRARQSAKWTVYGPDVLPAWVAEMDFPLADPVRRALHAAVDGGDAGYASPGDFGEVFATWALDRWQWKLAPSGVHLVADVVTGIAEILRVATAPGDGVVIEPPVYPPFAGTIRRLGRTVVQAPLLRGERGWAPDLAAIERAYAGGARAHIADEIHAPLTLAGAMHTPFPTASAAARRCSIVATSASKTWNIAGLKAAVLVASDDARDHDAPAAVLARLPPDTPYHAGHFGVIASKAALREGHEWLGQTLVILDRNRRLLAELLRAELPTVGYLPPQAGYLAWLDCRALGLGADPARTFLTQGAVALSSGPTFGTEGEGFARLNIATTRKLLEEAVRRMRRAI